MESVFNVLWLIGAKVGEIIPTFSFWKLTPYSFIKLNLSFFMALFFYFEHKRIRDVRFKYLFLIFFIFFVKELFYHYLGVDMVKLKAVPITGGVRWEQLESSIYRFKFFLWHIGESLFVWSLAYLIIKWKTIGRKKGLSGAKAFLTVSIVITLLLMLFVWISSPASKSYKSQGFAEFIKTADWFWGLWRVFVLVYLISEVAKVYGFEAERLPLLGSGGKILIGSISVFIVLYLFSSVVFIPQHQGWYIIQILGLLMLSYFGYNAFKTYMHGKDEQIMALERERELIIELMREISDTLTEALDMDLVLERIVKAAVRGTNARAGAILLKDKFSDTLSVKFVEGLFPPLRPIKVVGSAVKEKTLVDLFKAEKIKIGEGLFGQVAATGEPLFIRNALEDERVIQPARDIIEIKSLIVVPLKTGSDIFGVMAVINRQDRDSFYDTDLGVLSTMGDQAAITIRQFQMYQEILEKKQAEKELSVASEIQMSLLPRKFPQTDKFDMYAFSIPAKGVGGDYYDYIEFSENKLAITMADVSGKGVPAALIMVMIRSILRTVASLDREARDVMTMVNNSLSGDIVEDRYATMYYFVFDADKGIVNYSNAGHGPLLIYRASKDVFEEMDVGGIPVGIMPGVEYEQGYTSLESGDIAVLYTDGITEAMNHAHELFGLERLKEVLRQNKELSAKELADKVLEEVNKFVAGAPQHDDETLLVVKMK